MHVAHFVHRYPPALGGSEAYVARLSEYLAERGDDVTRLDDDGGRPGGVVAGELGRAQGEPWRRLADID